MDLTPSHYESVFRDGTDAIIIETVEGEVVEMNSAAVKTYGWDRSEVIGQPIKKIVPPNWHEHADRILKECLQGKEVRNVEGLRLAKDGTTIPVLITLSLLFDQSGAPWGVISFAKETTELRRAEGKLRRLARVFQDAADPIIIEDLDGIVSDANQAAIRDYGFSQREIFGSSIRLIVPPECHAQSAELLERCLAGEEVRDVETKRRTKAGRDFPVLVTLSLLSDESGEAVGVASFAKDISALKSAEAELRTLNSHLEQRVIKRTKQLELANDRLEHELAVARELNASSNRQGQIYLMGQSIATQALRDHITEAAMSNSPTLLTGPAGAGMELVARAIHHRSARSSGPFIYINCDHLASAGERLFETTGEGVSTRADSFDGKAILALRGTLYLEFVERLEFTTQLRLLQFMESEHDVGIITHAGTDLALMVARGNFDAHLRRRLSEHRVWVPPLADRRKDILVMAEQILRNYGKRLGKAVSGISEDSQRRMESYSWPGNIDELDNVLHRAAMLADGKIVDVPAELLREGRRVGGYTLVRPIGRGAMGEVWLGRHALLSRTAAIKLIHGATFDNNHERDVMQARFKREAKATSRLRSPHTVELYDFGVTEHGDFYYVMEHLDGMDLEALIRHCGTLPPGRVVFLLNQLCFSLGEAHELGIIHRDLKTQNIFVCRLGRQYDFLKVLDFGMVRSSFESEASMTAAGELTGSAVSMAPELIAGQEPSPAVDIYGAGCLAYEMLTGRHVFETDAVLTLLLNHSHTAPEPPSTYNSQVSPELDELVLSCLEKKPTSRPASAFELRDRLSRIALQEDWSHQQAQQWWDEVATN